MAKISYRRCGKCGGFTFNTTLNTCEVCQPQNASTSSSVTEHQGYSFNRDPSQTEMQTVMTAISNAIASGSAYIVGSYEEYFYCVVRTLEKQGAIRISGGEARRIRGGPKVVTDTYRLREGYTIETGYPL